MASVKLADVIIPEVFTPYMTVRTTELSELWTSGIVQTVPELGILGRQGGDTIQMPFWKDLSGSEEILSDTTPLTVDKITTDRDIAVLHARGKAWGANDLAKALSGADPMAAIGDLTAAYWARRMQKQLLSTLQGVFAAASMAGNVSDITAAVGDAGIIGADTIIDAIYKLGDAAGSIAAIITHSAAVAVLAKKNLVSLQPDSEGRPTIPFYLGKRVIVDDTMPVSGGNYTAYLFAAGAIGYGEGNAPVPVETDRDSLQGDDILINRRHYVLHPRGIRWAGTPAGVSPTNTELETGTNWVRVYDNKLVRVVKFIFRLS